MNLIINKFVGSSVEIDIANISNRVICVIVVVVVVVDWGLSSGVCIILFDLARAHIKLLTRGLLKKEVL